MPIHVKDRKSGDPLPSHMYVKTSQIKISWGKQLTRGPCHAALSGNVQPHVGHLEVSLFLCIATSCCQQCSQLSSFVFHLSYSRIYINRGEHLAEWHMKWEPEAQSSATENCLSVESTFGSTFVLWWCGAVFLNSHFSQSLKGTHFCWFSTSRAWQKAVVNSWQPWSLANPPVGSWIWLSVDLRSHRWAQVGLCETPRQAQLHLNIEIVSRQEARHTCLPNSLLNSSKCERNLLPLKGL